SPCRQCSWPEYGSQRSTDTTPAVCIQGGNTRAGLPGPRVANALGPSTGRNAPPALTNGFAVADTVSARLQVDAVLGGPLARSSGGLETPCVSRPYDRGILVEEGRHSWMGIASFVLSLVSAALACTFFMSSIIFPEMVTPLVFLLPLASLVLGIAGLVGKTERRLYALLGTVVSGVVFVAVFSMNIWWMSRIMPWW
ncbi:MAG: hypothetical protein JXA87_14265, partial [Thermoleophilia bacterium]|nr:hypothetical protein [Thermoleophilia bacterium]